MQGTQATEFNPPDKAPRPAAATPGRGRVPRGGTGTRPLILQQLHCNFNQKSKTGISDDNNAFKN